MREKNSSKCYDQKSWQSYHAGSLSESERLEMAEHLLKCAGCLDTYLGIVETRLKDENAPRLGEDFTAKVFAALKRETININAKRDKEVRNSKVNLFIAYCAAAGIAMFFWVGGYFDGLSGSLGQGAERFRPNEAIEVKTLPARGLIQAGWTKKVMENEHQSFLENIILKKE